MEKSKMEGLGNSGPIKSLDTNEAIKNITDLTQQAQKAAEALEKEEAQRLAGHLTNHQILIDNRNKILALGTKTEEAVKTIEQEIKSLNDKNIAPSAEITEAYQKAKDLAQALQVQLEETSKRSGAIFEVSGVKEKVMGEAEQEDKEFNDKKEQAELVERAAEMKTKAREEITAEVEAFLVLLKRLTQEYTGLEERLKNIEENNKKLDAELDSLKDGMGHGRQYLLFDRAERGLRYERKTTDEVRSGLEKQKEGLGWFGKSKEQHVDVNAVIGYLPKIAEAARVAKEYDEVRDILYNRWPGLAQLTAVVKALKAKAQELNKAIRELSVPLDYSDNIEYFLSDSLGKITSKTEEIPYRLRSTIIEAQR